MSVSVDGGGQIRLGADVFARTKVIFQLVRRYAIKTRGHCPPSSSHALQAVHDNSKTAHPMPCISGDEHGTSLPLNERGRNSQDFQAQAGSVPQKRQIVHGPKRQVCWFGLRRRGQRLEKTQRNVNIQRLALINRPSLELPLAQLSLLSLSRPGTVLFF